uniref:RNase H type-1 domain-containing protein n=1 Tax=Opuntia streptacantha TaxID=393608 RepID=A0A7C9CIR9_OPUST
MGQLLKLGACCYGSASILVAEARAMKDGIAMAIQEGFHHIIVEGDNKMVIQAAQGIITIPWRIQVIIDDISSWRSIGIHFTFHHILREANRAADWLAHCGHNTNHTLLSDTCFSPDLQVILCDDVVGQSFVRKGA